MQAEKRELSTRARNLYDLYGIRVKHTGPGYACISLMKKTADTGSRYAELDGLRGLAILMVLVWHYVGVPLKSAELGGQPSGLSQGLSLAWSGVDLFFVLSGFLIGGILLDNKEGSNYFRAFYARRVCRIFPLYFLFLLAFFVLLAFPYSPALFGGAFGWLFGNPMPSWSYLTLTQNFAMVQEGKFGPNWLTVTWSLAVEEHFYLVLPFLIWLVPKKGLPYVLAGLILAVPLSRVILLDLYPGLGQMSSYLLSPFRADALLLGVLCAWTVRNERFLNRLHGSTKTLYIYCSQSWRRAACPSCFSRVTQYQCPAIFIWHSSQALSL